MKLSLVVPSNRRLDRVFPLLKSLEKQRLRESDCTNFEVIWVINGLPFASCQELLSPIEDPAFRSQVHLLYRPAANANEARNLGAEAAHGEHLWFLDDDLELPSPFLLQKVLDKVTDRAAKFGQEWAMGGSYILGDSTPVGKDYFHISQSFTRSVSSEGAAFLLGGFFVLPRALFQRLGGFDQSRVWGGAELELNRKLRRGKIRCERVEEWNLLHHLELTSSQLIRKAISQGEGARPYTDFRTEFSEVYYRVNWNVRRYMTAFHIGLEASPRVRRLYRRCPWILDFSLSFNLALWRTIDSLPKLDAVARIFWKALWHLLHLKNIGRAERMRLTEIEYHQVAKRIMRKLSMFLFFRELRRLENPGEKRRPPRFPGRA